jgi:Ca-activated chloride channel homolog
VEVDRPDDNHATASYEANNLLPDSDYDLYYSVGSTEAYHLISYRDPGDPTDPDGFFLLMLSPKPGVANRIVSKDVLIVLDHSGSMDGEKFQQAQAALRYILQHLNPGDRFHLTTFSSDVQMYASELRPASEASAALDWASGISAEGSTDINRALLESAAVADKERPTYLIFLTDGLPTEGVTENSQILENFQKAARDNIRVFAFGVGYDVDTFLLDSLSGEHHGQSSYVRPSQSLDEVLSGFYARISTPVLTNLRLDFGSKQVYDVYPNPLPDLFTGSQVVVTGRYKKGGTFDASLYGNVNGLDQAYRYPEQVLVEDSRSIRGAPTGLPRLWATRKIGSLLNELRLKGNNKEIIDQIVHLSIRYGIVTPYTSYLVTEPMPLGSGAQNRVVDQAFGAMQSAPAAPASGQAAVQKAAEQGALSQADAPAAMPEDSAQKVRVVGARTFVNQDGVWMDTVYDPDKMKPVKVEFLSPDYFKLAQSSPEIGAALAVGERVIFVVGSTAYEVVSQGTPAAPLALPTTLAPAPTEAGPVQVQPTDPQPRVIETGVPVTSATIQPTKGAEQPVEGRGFSLSLVLLPCLGGLLTLVAALWVFKSK